MEQLNIMYDLQIIVVILPAQSPYQLIPLQPVSSSVYSLPKLLIKTKIDSNYKKLRIKELFTSPAKNERIVHFPAESTNLLHIFSIPPPPVNYRKQLVLLTTWILGYWQPPKTTTKNLQSLMTL